MPYLIDGHNVIGQTRGLSLEDPDDELKLVRLVRQLCMREGARRRSFLTAACPAESPTFLRRMLK